MTGKGHGWNQFSGTRFFFGLEQGPSLFCRVDTGSAGSNPKFTQTAQTPSLLRGWFSIGVLVDLCVLCCVLAQSMPCSGSRSHLHQLCLRGRKCAYLFFNFILRGANNVYHVAPTLMTLVVRTISLSSSPYGVFVTLGSPKLAGLLVVPRQVPNGDPPISKCETLGYQSRSACQAGISIGSPKQALAVLSQSKDSFPKRKNASPPQAARPLLWLPMEGMCVEK